MLKILLAAVGALVITLLAAYAAALLWKLRRQNMDRQSQHEEAQTDQAYSVYTLAKAVHEEGLNLSEAAIRIRVLLDHLLPTDEAESNYPGIHGLYLATRDLPRRLDRQALPRKHRQQLDAKREIEESRFRVRVLDETRELQTRFKPEPMSE